MSSISEQLPPTLAEIDRRIEERVAAEHQLMIDVMGDVLAQLKHDAEMRGPPGPSGPRGEEGPADGPELSRIHSSTQHPRHKRR